MLDSGPYIVYTSDIKPGPKLGVLYKVKHPLSFEYCGMWRSGGSVIVYNLILN